MGRPVEIPEAEPTGPPEPWRRSWRARLVRLGGCTPAEAERKLASLWAARQRVTQEHRR